MSLSMYAWSVLVASSVLAGPPQTVDEQEDESSAEQRSDVPVFETSIVVSASRTEEEVTKAPVAVSIISSEELEATPAQNYADLLRSIPGVNAAQFSARHVSIAPRVHSSIVARTTLAVVDGRAVNQWYFGHVNWDQLPVGLGEIERIEVIRGPGSAIWGAYAASGVVSVITKSPRDLAGTRLRVRGGEVGTLDVAALHAGVAGDWSYKLSGSYYRQDAWERDNTLPDGTPMVPYDNPDVDGAKLDVRLDWDRPGAAPGRSREASATRWAL